MLSKITKSISLGVKVHSGMRSIQFQPTRQSRILSIPSPYESAVPVLLARMKSIFSQTVTRTEFKNCVNESTLSFLVVRKMKPLYQSVRLRGEYLPPTQYDTPIPIRLNLLYVLREYWEIIPLFMVTAVACTICFSSILWAISNKVDVVFTSRSRRNISRTMDLRNPTVHKIIIINERYLPWPEMQAVIEKMASAEKRALLRTQACGIA